jgi:Predicted hydrolase (HAD superfamily)
LFCHIHSKKSLYSGSEQTEWRRSNLGQLLGSAEHVGRIQKIFQKQPELGVAAPLPNPTMPYWAFTWLSNLRSGAELSQKLRMSFPFEGYFDYPLGCMFWARPAALKQLLDGRIKASDFPEEGGQTDGTLAHAIERSIYFVARHNGFGWIEIDRDQGVFKEGWSERNIHQYQSAKTFSNFKREIDACDTICFDIFDTLITRIVPKPDDLFDMVEMGLDGDSGQKSEFHRHRKEAEGALRLAKSSGDVSYDEIYAELARRKEAAPIAKRAYEMEEAFEKQATVPRRQMVRALNYARERGKRVILASDMYMHRAQVEALLSKSGVVGFDKLYLSSETGLRKDDLSLWHHLIEEEGAQKPGFLHVGDNEHSDVQVPLGLGIRFYHVLSPRNLFDFTPLGYRMRRMQGVHQRKPMSLGPTIASLCNDPFEGRA